jgi:phasin family protein
MSRAMSQAESLKTNLLHAPMPRIAKEKQKEPEQVSPEAAAPAEPPKAAAVSPTLPEIDYSAFGLASGNAMNALLRANSAMLKGMADLSQEMSEFASSRLRENAQRSTTLLNCTDPAEAFKLQYDFASKATEQYLEEAAKLMTLALQTSSKCWAPLEECTRETVARATSVAGEKK